MTYITMAGAVLVTLVTNVLAADPDEPLEPEKAFALSVRLAPAADPAIHLKFAIADGHYLYRDRFKVEVAGLPTGAPEIPSGIRKDDPFVGPTVILKGEAVLRVPFVGTPRAGRHVVKVTAQGCAEDRLCYAPFTQSASITIPAGYGTPTPGK